MATDQIDLDLDSFDDMGLDISELDIDMGAKPKEDTRSPIVKTSKSFLAGLKESIVRPKIIEDTITDILPPAYGQIRSKYSTVVDQFGGIKEDIKKQLKPEIKRLKKIVKFGIPEAEKYLPKQLIPKGIKEKLTAFSEDTGFSDSTGAIARLDPKEIEIQRSLASVFGDKEEEQGKRSALEKVEMIYREKRADLRTKATLSTQSATNDLLNRLVAYQDKITANYQRQSLELRFRHYFVAKDLFNVTQAAFKDVLTKLADIQTNTALPDVQKVHKSEIWKGGFFSKLIGSKGEAVGDIGLQYWDKTKENIGAKIQEKMEAIMSPLDMLMGAAEDYEENKDMMGDMDEGGGNKPLVKLLGTELAEKLKEKLIAPIRKRVSENETIQKGETAAIYAMENAPELLKETAERQWSDPVINWLAEQVRGVLPPTLGKREEVGKRLKTTGLEAIPFDVLTRRSIVEIIPGFLSRIHQGIMQLATGDSAAPRIVYDSGSEDFITLKQAGKQAGESITGEDVKFRIDQMFSGLFGSIDREDTLSEDEKKLISRRLIEDADKGVERFDPRKLYSADWYNEEVDPELLKELKEIVKENYSFTKLGGLDISDPNLTESARWFRGLIKNLPNAQDLINQTQAFGESDILRETGLIEKGEGGGETFSHDTLWDKLVYGDTDEAEDEDTDSDSQGKGRKRRRRGGGRRGGGVDKRTILSLKESVDQSNRLLGEIKTLNEDCCFNVETQFKEIPEQGFTDTKELFLGLHDQLAEIKEKEFTVNVANNNNEPINSNLIESNQLLSEIKTINEQILNKEYSVNVETIPVIKVSNDESNRLLEEIKTINKECCFNPENEFKEIPEQGFNNTKELFLGLHDLLTEIKEKEPAVIINDKDDTDREFSFSILKETTDESNRLLGEIKTINKECCFNPENEFKEIPEQGFNNTKELFLGLHDLLTEIKEKEFTVNINDKDDTDREFSFSILKETTDESNRLLGEIKTINKEILNKDYPVIVENEFKERTDQGFNNTKELFLGLHDLLTEIKEKEFTVNINDSNNESIVPIFHESVDESNRLLGEIKTINKEILNKDYPVIVENEFKEIPEQGFNNTKELFLGLHDLLTEIKEKEFTVNINDSNNESIVPIFHESVDESISLLGEIKTINEQILNRECTINTETIPPTEESNHLLEEIKTLNKDCCFNPENEFKEIPEQGFINTKELFLGLHDLLTEIKEKDPIVNTEDKDIVDNISLIIEAIEESNYLLKEIKTINKDSRFNLESEFNEIPEQGFNNTKELFLGLHDLLGEIKDDITKKEFVVSIEGEDKERGEYPFSILKETTDESNRLLGEIKTINKEILNKDYPAIAEIEFKERTDQGFNNTTELFLGMYDLLEKVKEEIKEKAIAINTELTKGLSTIPPLKELMKESNRLLGEIKISNENRDTNIDREFTVKDEGRLIDGNVVPTLKESIVESNYLLREIKTLNETCRFNTETQFKEIPEQGFTNTKEFTVNIVDSNDEPIIPILIESADELSRLLGEIKEKDFVVNIEDRDNINNEQTIPTTTESIEESNYLLGEIKTINKECCFNPEKEFKEIPDRGFNNTKELLLGIHDLLAEIKEKEFTVKSEDRFVDESDRERVVYFREDILTHLEAISKGVWAGVEAVVASGGTGTVINVTEDRTGDIIKKSLGKLVSGTGGLLKGYGQALGGVGSLFKSTAGAITRTSILSDVIDIYVAGDDEPRLSAKKLRKAHYLNINTDKPVQYIKDITGPVVDVENNMEMVITDEDMDRGFYTISKTGMIQKALTGALSIGKSLFSGYASILKIGGGVIKRIAKTGKQLMREMKGVKDIYVGSEMEPRLLGIVMRRGGYYSAITGKPIFSLKDIDGSILDSQQRVIVSIEEIDNLYDKSGKKIDIRSLSEKLLAVAGSALASIGRTGLKAAKGIGRLALAGFKLPLKMVRGTAKAIATRGPKFIRESISKLAKKMGYEITKADVEKIPTGDIIAHQQLDILNRIYSLLDQRLIISKKVRKGSWQEQLAEDEVADEAEVKEKKRKREARKSARTTGSTAAVTGAATGGWGGDEDKEEGEEDDGLLKTMMGIGVGTYLLGKAKNVGTAIKGAMGLGEGAAVAGQGD